MEPCGIRGFRSALSPDSAKLHPSYFQRSCHQRWITGRPDRFDKPVRSDFCALTKNRPRNLDGALRNPGISERAIPGFRQAPSGLPSRSCRLEFTLHQPQHNAADLSQTNARIALSFAVQPPPHNAQCYLLLFAVIQAFGQKNKYRANSLRLAKPGSYFLLVSKEASCH
jgi:hypothetical protein